MWSSTIHEPLAPASPFRVRIAFVTAMAALCGVVLFGVAWSVLAQGRAPVERVVID